MHKSEANFQSNPKHYEEDEPLEEDNDENSDKENEENLF